MFNTSCVESLQCPRLGIHTQNIMAKLFIYHLTFCLEISSNKHWQNLPAASVKSVMSAVSAPCVAVPIQMPTY